VPLHAPGGAAPAFATLIRATPLLLGLFFVCASGALAQEIDGLHRQTMRWGGHDRSYLIHVPATGGSAPTPLVIVLHGAGGNAADFAAETQFVPAADARGMTVVFPDGTGTQPGQLSWNAHFCCGAAASEQTDDVGFVGALIDDVTGKLSIDRKRIYATGMSNGGMLAYQLAAAHPDWLAAIAPVSATIGGTNRNGDTFVIEAPDRPMPVMIIHGRKDSFVLFEGGSSPMLNHPKRSNISVGEAMAFWAKNDECPAPPEETEPTPGRLRRVAYVGCRAGSQVVLWEIEDGDHNWPAADVRFSAADGSTRSAAAEILAFFAGFHRD
jgi:polyhydroxybutyrate depolymerase